MDSLLSYVSYLEMFISFPSFYAVYEPESMPYKGPGRISKFVFLFI